MPNPTRTFPRWFEQVLTVVVPLLVFSRPAAAQLPIRDFTGKPAAALSTPFTLVSHAVTLGGGQLLFIDEQEHRVVAADVARDRITTIGRSGAGPGEYRTPFAPVADGRGGAIIPDQALDRALMISPDGRVTGAGFSRRESGGVAAIAIGGFDPQGRILRANRGSGSVQPSDSMVIERFDPKTNRSDFLAYWPMVISSVGKIAKAGNGGTAQGLISLPWPKRAQWVALPNGSVAVARSNPYRVDITTPDGALHLGAAIADAPIKVTAAERDAFRKERGPYPNSQFPAEKPAFEGGLSHDVVASGNNEIWIRRLRAWNDTTPVYDIFDSLGRRIAQARFRPHTEVIGFGPGVVYVARQTPADDLWYVEQYSQRLVPN